MIMTRATLASPKSTCPPERECEIRPCFLANADNCSVYYICEVRDGENTPVCSERPPGLYLMPILSSALFRGL